jgi:hypothetical protein
MTCKHEKKVPPHLCIVGILGSMRKLYGSQIMLFAGGNWVASSGFEHGISRMGVCLASLQNVLQNLLDRRCLPA